MVLNRWSNFISITLTPLTSRALQQQRSRQETDTVSASFQRGEEETPPIALWRDIYTHRELHLPPPAHTSQDMLPCHITHPDTGENKAVHQANRAPGIFKLVFLRCFVQWLLETGYWKCASCFMYWRPLPERLGSRLRGFNGVITIRKHTADIPTGSLDDWWRVVILNVCGGRYTGGSHYTHIHSTPALAKALPTTALHVHLTALFISF